MEKGAMDLSKKSFFLLSHNGTREDIKVPIIGHCDPSDQESREYIWISYLDTLHLKDLSKKRALKY